MKHHKLVQLMTVLVLVTVLSMACNVLQPATTTPVPPTSTPVPPTPTPASTSTPTPVPPTPTPTLTPTPENLVSTDGFDLQIISASLVEEYMGYSHPFMTEDEILLAIEVRVLPRDAELVGELDVWATDENGGRSREGNKITMVIGDDTVVWLLLVARTSHAFVLHFPSGETFDLSPLLP